MRTGFFAKVGAGVFVLAADSIGAQAPVPVGGEFQVNVVAGGNQRFSSIGAEPDGDFVVVWESFDGSEFGVFARRFNSSGVAQAGQFQINTYTTSNQYRPAVDVDADGDFVVAWTSEGQDGSITGIFARRFGSAGGAVTGEFMINTTTQSVQAIPGVASESNGDFVVVWTMDSGAATSFNAFGRRFNSAGTPQGPESRVNSFTQGAQGNPAVDMDADGDFVVTWDSNLQDGSLYGVFGQRFDSTGAPQGPEFQVNTTFTFSQRLSRVGVDADGDFVVVWFSLDASEVGIFGRRFASSGTPQGVEFPVNSHQTDDQFQPVVAVDADGDFVVAWTGQLLDGSGDGVFVRRFKASGIPQNLDTKVNTTTIGDQNYPAVAVNADGDFIVSWTSAPGAYADIFAQRFDTLLTIDVDGDGQYLPLTDGLLLVRFGFGFTGNALITGAVGAGCTRCDAPSITAYLQTLV